MVATVMAGSTEMVRPDGAVEDLRAGGVVRRATPERERKKSIPPSTVAKELENRPTIEVAVHSHGNAPYLPPMKVSFFKVSRGPRRSDRERPRDGFVVRLCFSTKSKSKPTCDRERQPIAWKAVLGNAGDRGL